MASPVPENLYEKVEKAIEEAQKDFIDNVEVMEDNVSSLSSLASETLDMKVKAKCKK